MVKFLLILPGKDDDDVLVVVVVVVEDLEGDDDFLGAAAAFVFGRAFLVGLLEAEAFPPPPSSPFSPALRFLAAAGGIGALDDLCLMVYLLQSTVCCYQ